MTKRPTRNDVARSAGVSGWTVSQILNGNTGISIREETRQRVLAAARELGYRPNNSARALVTGQSSTVGFWMSFEYSQHRMRVLHLMQQEMKDSAFELIIRDAEREMQHNPNFEQSNQLPIDGIIAFDTPTAGATFTHDHPTQLTPFVSMGAFWAKERDFVGVDLYTGTVEAVEHLIASGRKHICYLAPTPEENWPIDSRYLAYMTALHNAGLTPHCLWAPEKTLASARSTIREFLLLGGKADALFCHNDDMAFGAYRALCDVGADVGSEIALVGCDGIEEGEYLACPLTTIAQPVREMCALSWQFLLARMKNPAIPLQQEILTPKLVIRESSSR